MSVLRTLTQSRSCKVNKVKVNYISLKLLQLFGGKNTLLGWGGFAEDGSAHLLLLQRTQVLFPVPTQGLTTTLTPGPGTHLHMVYINAHRYTSYKHFNGTTGLVHDYTTIYIVLAHHCEPKITQPKNNMKLYTTNTYITELTYVCVHAHVRMCMHSRECQHDQKRISKKHWSTLSGT